MEALFVVRLLDAENELLSWTRVVAEAKPQATRASCPFFAKGPTRFIVEKDGIAAKVSIHWVDLDIARVSDLAEPLKVRVLQQLDYGWLEPVWLTAGMQDVPLPQVTERQPVSITVPTGAMGLIPGSLIEQ